MLQKQSTGRVPLSEGGCTSLAEIGKQLGQLVLEEVAPLVQSETALAWHRKLVAKKCVGSQHRGALQSRHHIHWRCCGVGHAWCFDVHVAVDLQTQERQPDHVSVAEASRTRTMRDGIPT